MSAALFITGPAGSGKSKLLANAANLGVRLARIDALASVSAHWEQAWHSTAGSIDVVAIDHLEHLDWTAAAFLHAAASWALQQEKPLWILGSSRAELYERMQQIGIHLRPAQTLELSLSPVLSPDLDLPDVVQEAHGRRFLNTAYGQWKEELILSTLPADLRDSPRYRDFLPSRRC